MTFAQLRLILGALVALSATVMSCAKRHAADETTPAFARQLGESTASPGDNPSKPAPVTADDPRRMNVSMGIRNLPNPEIAPPGAMPRTEGTATSPNATANPNTTTAAPNANPPAAPDPATSSTDVAPPADVTPPSTTSQEPARPGVFSPPPPSDSPSPTPQPAPAPAPAPGGAPAQ